MNKIPNIQGKWNTKIELFRMSFLGKQKPNFDKNITNLLSPAKFCKIALNFADCAKI